MLFKEIGQRGLRKTEIDGIKPETSQVLAKVFKALREQGITKDQIARDLAIWPDGLDRIVFKLVLTPLAGTGNGSPPDAQRPDLRLIQ